MTIPRCLVILCFSFALGGCFQASLGGPAGEATLRITELRGNGAVVPEAPTMGVADWVDVLGQPVWDDLDPQVQLLLPGSVSLDTDSLDPDTLYLVTASGGIDYDPDNKGKGISDNPEAVQGSWHAVAEGRRLMDGKIQVSVLSEASYRQLASRLGDLSDADVRVQLDAAARLLVTDVDASGSVDHDDILEWTRSGHAAAYRQPLRHLNALAAAIRSGQPAEMLDKLAEKVFGNHDVSLVTNFGTIELRTLNWFAPVTADNFLRYVADNFYEQIIFHRSIPGFMIQTGYWELQEDGRRVLRKEGRGTIRNESRYSLSNRRGTLSMARTSDPDSAGSQFFINQSNNSFLDYGSSDNPDGYAVFARVVSGLEVVDTINALPTGSVSGIGSDVPAEVVVIESVTLEE